MRAVFRSQKSEVRINTVDDTGSIEVNDAKSVNNAKADVLYSDFCLLTSVFLYRRRQQFLDNAL